jgi:hypothetical protein
MMSEGTCLVCGRDHEGDCGVTHIWQLLKDEKLKRKVEAQLAKCVTPEERARMSDTADYLAMVILRTEGR